MQQSVRLVGLAGIAALGVGAAVAVGASGDKGVRACAATGSGEIRAAGAGGKCSAGNFPITISGQAFKSSKNGTLTINGVDFKRGSRKSITINGTAFRSSSNRTLTINGTAFKGSGNTLTINGIPFSQQQAAGPGPAGPAGPVGPQGAEGAVGRVGPTGTSHTLGVAPSELALKRVGVDDGPGELVTADFSKSDQVPHRLLLTGGFDAVCNPCGTAITARTSVARGNIAVLARRLPDLGAGQESTSAVVSQVVVTPTACGPCTYALRLTATSATGSNSEAVLDASGISFALVDLGPVSP